MKINCFDIKTIAFLSLPKPKISSMSSAKKSEWCLFVASSKQCNLPMHNLKKIRLSAQTKPNKIIITMINLLSMPVNGNGSDPYCSFKSRSILNSMCSTFAMIKSIILPQNIYTYTHTHTINWLCFLNMTDNYVIMT